jgi:hypothetical protein
MTSFEINEEENRNAATKKASTDLIGKEYDSLYKE